MPVTALASTLTRFADGARHRSPPEPTRVAAIARTRRPSRRGRAGSACRSTPHTRASLASARMARSVAVISSARRWSAPGAKTCGVLRWIMRPGSAVWSGSRRTFWFTRPAPSSKGGLWQLTHAAAVRARGARRARARPLVRRVEIGARHAREALLVADVRADAVERVEARLEQLVAAAEGDLEAERAVADGVQLRLVAVLGHRIVEQVHDGELGVVGDDGVGRQSGETRKQHQENPDADPCEHGSHALPLSQARKPRPADPCSARARTR